MLGQPTAPARVGSTGKPRMDTGDCSIVLEELGDCEERWTSDEL